MTINVFAGELNKVKWENTITNTSYRYLGIDSDNNLHIERKELNHLLNKEDVCQLIFKTDLNKPTQITLTAQKSLKAPLLITIQVEAGNKSIKTKYLGDLPFYND